MRQVLRMALSALTFFINLFEALRNFFCLKFSRADSISYGSTSHHVDATSTESTSDVDTTPIDSRMAVEEGQWTDLPHHLLSKIASGLGLMEFLSFRCVCRDWRIASSEVSHEDKSSEFEPWFLIYGGEGSQCSLISNEYKRYTSDIQELDGASCLASYEGWLLLLHQGSLFFFCPFSKAKIELPTCPFTGANEHIAALSSAPTAQDCTVVVLSRINFYELQLSMLCRGKKLWTKYCFLGHHCNRIRSALFYEEGKEFHFLDGGKFLITFNASKRPHWNCYNVYSSRDLPSSSEVLVLNYRINESLFEHHNDTGMARYLEENESISTCGTTVPHSSRQYDMIIGSESIAASNQSETETRHLKGVWIQPKYCYVPPGQTW